MAYNQGLEGGYCHAHLTTTTTPSMQPSRLQALFAELGSAMVDVIEPVLTLFMNSLRIGLTEEFK